MKNRSITIAIEVEYHNDRKLTSKQAWKLANSIANGDTLNAIIQAFLGDASVINQYPLGYDHE